MATHITWRAPLLAAAVACLGFTLASPSNAETIRIGGTGAALGTMRQLGNAFQKRHPEHTVRDVPSLGSSGGIKALQTGVLEIAVISRELKPEEKSAGLQLIQYGTTPVVFAMHRQAPPIKLTKDSIADIYSGKLANLPNGQPIRLVMRPKQESDTLIVQKISPAVDAAVRTALDKNGMVMAVTDTESADQIEKYPSSLGLSTLALIISESRQLNVLPLDGVVPSVQSLENGTYPLFKPVSMVVTAAPSAGARAFIQFVQSPQGQQILQGTGHKTTAGK